jgi:hypothetical protein
MLCKYKDIFGKEGEGAHSIRVANLAVVDVMLTILAGYLISRAFRVSFLWVCVVLFILGIVMHRLFCVNTTVNKMIFGVV